MIVSPPHPIIFGLSGTEVTLEERAFFKEANPLGFILFRWNLEEPQQIRSLIKELKSIVGREDLLFLVDAEGGRVFRLPKKFYPSPPPARFFGDLYQKDPEEAVRLCRKSAYDTGLLLKDLGFTVNCSPLLDLYVEGAHDVIGDRAFSDDPDVVGTLGAAVVEGLQQAQILPVIKHIPGHGAALVDSHEALPVVGLSREELRPHFRPFIQNRNAPLAMTAHVVYEAFDPHHCATFSPTVIQHLIREEIGFKGFLLSDDLFMGAVSGTPSEKVATALKAGCDAVLYCKGGVSEFAKALAFFSEGSFADGKRA